MTKKIAIFFYILVFCLGISLKGSAQDKALKDLKSRVLATKKLPKRDTGTVWTIGATYVLNMGQGSLSNWAAGGDDFSFSINTYIGLYGRYKKNKISWDNTVDLNYGLMFGTSQGERKTDDRIDANSKVGYALNSSLNLAGLFNFHSQFTRGYSYKSDGTKELLSNFMAPGYVLFSLGFDYLPVKGLSIFISPITSRWIFMNDDSLSAKGSYGVKAGDKVSTEIGSFASITYWKLFSKKVTYKGRLDLFSNYSHNPGNVDVLMNNLLIAKVSRVFSFNIGIDLIYDDDVKLFGKDHDSPGLQMKQVIGAGLALKF